MDLTKYRNQINALQRCMVNVYKAQTELERVFGSKIHYKNDQDHLAAIELAQSNVLSAESILRNQAKLHSMENYPAIGPAFSAISLFLEEKVKELKQDLKDATPHNNHLHLNIITEMNAYKNVVRFIEGGVAHEN